MPIAKFKCIRETSSEDANCLAENLLSLKDGRKWKTKVSGEKSAFVVLELESPAQIVGIDIGNEHSAFIEILVSSAGCKDFKEILITCSFMTISESKNSSNPNRVRCFNKDALEASVASEKWNLIKVLCTQPFNKHVQYGVSFIKVHVASSEVRTMTAIPTSLDYENMSIKNNSKNTADNEKNEKVRHKERVSFGNISLREVSPDSDTENSVALFDRWKRDRGIKNVKTVAAAIRQASYNSTESPKNVKRPFSYDKSTTSSEGVSEKVLDRNRANLSFGMEPVEKDAKLRRISVHLEADKKMFEAQSKLKKKNEVSEILTNRLDTMKKPIKANENTSSSIELIHPSSSRKRYSSPTHRSSKKFMSENSAQQEQLSEILRGVVFVISGIQNPDRDNLRRKALEMGAKYKSDWVDGCTHLVCTFKNTPKYKQVKGKGKIVKREWIEKCYKMKKYLPWRLYALDSDDELESESDTETPNKTVKSTNNLDDVSPNSCSNTETLENKPFFLDSGSDTDEDIERFMQKSKKNESDGEGTATEEEEYIQHKVQRNRKHLNFFENMKFLIDEFSLPKKNQIERCIKHFGGSISQITSEADFFVAESLLNICTSQSSKIKTVNSQWILDCNEKEEILPVESYIIA